MKILVLPYLGFIIIGTFMASAQNLETSSNSDSLRLVVTSLIQNNELDAAISMAKEALFKEETKEDSLGIAQSLYLLSRAYAITGDFDSAIRYGERGSQICRKLGDHPLEFKTNNILSWAYFETGKDFTENLKHERRQVFLVNLMDDQNAKAMVYNNYGYDSTVEGSIPLDDAIAYMRYANDYYAKEEGTQGRWYTLMNLTWQYRLKGDLERSAEFGWKAVDRARKDNDRHAIIEANTNLGETLLAQNKIKIAEEVYGDALKESVRDLDRDKYVFDVYYARYLWKIDKKSEAIALLEKAIDFLTTSEVFYEMMGRATLANFYFKTNKKEQALTQLNIIENPRSDYISFESRFKAALIKYQILKEKGALSPIEHLQPFLSQAESIGAKQLTSMFEN